MEYKYILSPEQIVFKEFYVDHHLIAIIDNACGQIYINGHGATINSDSVFIIPKYSRISCEFNLKAKDAQIELQLLVVSDDILENTFKLIQAVKGSRLSVISGEPVYHLNTPAEVSDNFLLLQKVLPADENKKLKTTLLNQSLFFILMAINDAGIDVLNVFHFNYDEPKKQIIARLITGDPQRKWHIDDVAKVLFTTQATLRRHLAKEGISFCQLLLNVRMGLALNFLTFSNYSISQVSHRCGFGSTAYFCDAFRRKYSITPSHFRIKSRESNDMSVLDKINLKSA